MPEDIDPVLIEHEIRRARRYLSEPTDPLVVAIIACFVGAVALFTVAIIAIIWP